MGKIRNLAEWGNAVKKRDGFTCQQCRVCGGKKLHAHHIIPKSVDPQKELELANGVTLCDRCHKELHAKDCKEQRDFLTAGEHAQRTREDKIRMDKIGKPYYDNGWRDGLRVGMAQQKRADQAEIDRLSKETGRSNAVVQVFKKFILSDEKEIKSLKEELSYLRSGMQALLAKDNEKNDVNDIMKRLSEIQDAK